LIDHFKSRT